MFGVQLGSGFDGSNRLAVIMLSSDPGRLCCCLPALQARGLADTPADIFVFSSASVDMQSELEQSCNATLSDTYFFTLNEAEHWATPSSAGPESTWTPDSGWFSEEYRKMGHWR